MVKKNWSQPEIKDLELEKTEYGNALKDNPDASYNDGKNTWYSFS